MFEQPSSWLNPKCEARPNRGKGGHMVIALEAIAAGEVLTVWGGEIVTGEQLDTFPQIHVQRSVQVEEDLYMVPRAMGPADYFNHSCTPNAGMFGQIALVAMQPIAPGEEICYDYAMSDGSSYDEFTCGCRTQYCRGQITGEDWRSPELWERYAGYFSPYLQRRIDQLQTASESSDDNP